MKRLNQHQSLRQLKQWLAIVIGAASMLYMPAAFTETLKDPTQPPATLNSATVTDTITSAGPVLQSIMIGPQYQAAIINGEKVLLGKKYQAATLIKLNEREAVLRNPDMSTQTLLLDFAINKKILTPSLTPNNLTPGVDATTDKIKIKLSPKPISKSIEVSEK